MIYSIFISPPRQMADFQQAAVNAPSYICPSGDGLKTRPLADSKFPVRFRRRRFPALPSPGRNYPPVVSQEEGSALQAEPNPGILYIICAKHQFSDTPFFNAAFFPPMIRHSAAKLLQSVSPRPPLYIQGTTPKRRLRMN